MTRLNFPRFRIALAVVSVVTALNVSFAGNEINPPQPPKESVVTALIGARLIDGRGGRPIKNSIVVVRGSKIVSAGRASRVSIPASAERIDVRGMSLLPGLIDSHFHSVNTTTTPVTYELQHGITSFRDPGHPFRFYDAVRAFEGPMPRVFLCGGHLDGPPPVWPDQAVLITDTAHARQAVYDHVGNGATAIKVYFRLPLDQVRAACEAATERGVLVTAHLELVDADEAIRAGVRGIEHVTSFGTALAAEADAKQFKAAITADSGARRKMRHWLWSTLDLENSDKVKPLLDLLVEKNVFVSPTLAIYERRAGQKDGTKEQARAFANMIQFIGMCHEAGIAVVVGSHTAAPFAATGQAYQRELELLIDCGMTPLEAITAGMLPNARFLGIDDRLGTIEAGKLADLILVEGDPSKDIRAMRNVRRVMLNGTWVDGIPE